MTESRATSFYFSLEICIFYAAKMNRKNYYMKPIIHTLEDSRRFQVNAFSPTDKGFYCKELVIPMKISSRFTSA